MAESEYLTPKDIEQLLNLSHTTVSRLLNRPDFPAVRIGRSVRVRRDRFEEYMETYTGLKGVMI